MAKKLKISALKSRKKKNVREDIEIEIDDDVLESQTLLSQYDADEREDDGMSEQQIAIFSGVDDADEILYEDVEYQEDMENLHPAEMAARFALNETSSHVGGSDEQILKDLRKLVFSVPLLPQDEVAKLFDQIDSCLFPTVHAVLETSLSSLEDLLQVVIKVAAGNTYGKNIYDKDEMHREEEQNRDSESRGTYKDHEMRFLVNAYDVFRLYAYASNDKKCKISMKSAMDKCNFIRGVYEDIIENFVSNLKDYDDIHWKCAQAKISDDIEKHHELMGVLSALETKYRLGKSAYYVVRESKRIYQKYMEIRAQIITPYLKSVYSAAKKTAKNLHQMLDNFQNGSIGLMRAVSCYSTKRKACFASVAKCWIKQMMLLSIKEDANFVKLPVSTWQAYTQLEKAKLKLGVGEDELAMIAKQAKMPFKKAKAVYHTVRISQVYSLNRTYDSDEKLTLEDIMTNDNKLGGEDDTFVDMLRDYCGAADLSEMEIKVLVLRHGMLDLMPLAEMDPRERIRETLVQNLAKLGYNYKPN